MLGTVEIAGSGRPVVARRRSVAAADVHAMRLEDAPDWVFASRGGFFPDDADRTWRAVVEHRDLRARQRAFLEDHGLGHLGFQEFHAERCRRAGLRAIRVR
jgi:hypothetical protein